MPIALEIRLAIYALVVLGFVGCYFKGRLDEKAALTQKQLAENAVQMTKYQSTLDGRAAADDVARQTALAFVADINKRMDGVHAKFAQLPSVVVDVRGCEHLSESAGMRWNAVELLPAGSTDVTAGKPAEAVPATTVPAPR